MVALPEAVARVARAPKRLGDWDVMAICPFAVRYGGMWHSAV